MIRGQHFSNLTGAHELGVNGALGGSVIGGEGERWVPVSKPEASASSGGSMPPISSPSSPTCCANPTPRGSNGGVSHGTKRVPTKRVLAWEGTKHCNVAPLLPQRPSITRRGGVVDARNTKRYAGNCACGREGGSPTSHRCSQT